MMKLAGLFQGIKPVFYVAKEKTSFAYNEKGDVVGQRELTEEELGNHGICRSVKMIIKTIRLRLFARH